MYVSGFPKKFNLCYVIPIFRIVYKEVNIVLLAEMPSFFQSEYFNVETLELSDDAPDELKKEYEEFYAAVKDLTTGSLYGIDLEDLEIDEDEEY